MLWGFLTRPTSFLQAKITAHWLYLPRLMHFKDSDKKTYLKKHESWKEEKAAGI